MLADVFSFKDVFKNSLKSMNVCALNIFTVLERDFLFILNAFKMILN